MSVHLSVIIVSWNVRELLKSCLESLNNSERVRFASTPEASDAPEKGYRAHVTVVDNSSTDGTASMVRTLFPWVQLIASERNLGFTAANNLVMREQLRRAKPPDFFLLLNPDTVVAPDALATLLDFAVPRPDVGVVGPMLLNPDGSIQSSRRRFPSLLTALAESTIVEWRLWPRNPWVRRYHVLDRSPYEVQDVDWLTGACLLVRREAVETAGLLDERFFMYSEELDWCRRIKEAGFRVVYVPQARVVHYSAQSSEQVKTFQHVQFQRSKILYFRKHHGRLAAWVLWAFLMLNYAVLLLEESAKWLLTHRPLHRERMSGYRAVLASGLK